MQRAACYLRKMVAPSNSSKATAPKAKSSGTLIAKKTGGGTAIGGGVNFQAAVTAIVAVHILTGTPLNWLSGIFDDLPIAVWAESEGPGDDVRIEFAEGKVAEVQAKKGLVRSKALWDSLEAMALAVRDGATDFGVLAVATDSSSTVREDLAKDVERMGMGRIDHLTDVGSDLHARLIKMGIPIVTCQFLRIRVIHALAPDALHINVAVEALRSICRDKNQAGFAWDILYRDAISLMEHRGRRTLESLIRLLASSGIEIGPGESPAAVLHKLTDWTKSANASFRITGTRSKIPLSALLPMRAISVPFEVPEAEDASSALERYHKGPQRERDQDEYDASWTGRFVKRSVVVAGPGLGKSTLMTKLASLYAFDGYPILSVTLKSVAAAMRNGSSFTDALYKQALDGSGIMPAQFTKAALSNLVVIADGLDDCGAEHDDVAKAISDFADGHALVRIIVTTRPIGYSTAELSQWTHYQLLAPTKDQGAINLGRLISAASTGNIVESDSYEKARKELARTPAAEAISVNPQLLGMAASLIVKSGQLPTTRPLLYGQLIELFEALPNQAITGEPVSAEIAVAVLNSIGWVLLEDPLKTAKDVAQVCSRLLATELGVQPLFAAPIYEAAMRHWESVGLIERVYHDRLSLLTFVHKTFAEFVAARYLVSLPEDARLKQLDRLVDLPDWGEVVSFAGGIGLGDIIAKLFVDRRAKGDRGQLERALSLVGDRDANVSEVFARDLVRLAFLSASQDEDDALSLGGALCDLALKRADIVYDEAAKHIGTAQPTLKLVAWAAAISAKPQQFDADRLEAILTELRPNISTGISSSLLGGLRLGGRGDRALIEHIAIAALRAQPDDKIKAFAENELPEPAFRTWGFQKRVSVVLTARGVEEGYSPSWMRDSTLSLKALMTFPEEWHEASRCAIRVLAEAVAGDDSNSAPRMPDTHLLQFGALIVATQFEKVTGEDVYAWVGPQNMNAVRATLNALVAVTTIDRGALALEARELVRRIAENPNLDVFRISFPEVDVPEPEWSKVATLHVDRDQLVASMLHKSDWLVYVATNLLEWLPSDKIEAVALLATATGSSRNAVVALIGEQFPDAADLFFDRLEADMSGDLGPIFRALSQRQAPASDRLIKNILAGMTAPSVRTAQAAVNLYDDLRTRGEKIDVMQVERAYAHWETREPIANESGAIPDSPRSTLARMLVSLGAVDVRRALTLLGDRRSDINEIGRKWLLDHAESDENAAHSLIEAILDGKISPGLSAAVLATAMPIDDAALAKLKLRLGDEKPALRRAMMSLLTVERMLGSEIKAHAEHMTNDTEPEIRKAARAILASLGTEIG
ncbi:hypothetical protein ACVWZA_002356 [Sphingomonas sp. UYAg733]